MPDYSKTEIVIVLDRSGSMQPIAGDMEGGLKTFIDRQKKVVGTATVSLYQFDHVIDTVFVSKGLEEVDDIVLMPRGKTALFDALGKAINETGQRLAAIPEAQRPGNVVVMVITDGVENASKVFTRQTILDMVNHQKEKYSWQFAYLGTEDSTFRDARNIGMQGHSYQKNAGGVRGMSVGLSVSIDNYRTERNKGNLSAQLDIDERLESADPATSGS